VVRNDGVEALGRTQRWRGGSREDSMMERAPGRSSMARALEKFLVENFGNLTV
jgi:hypothetical protein